MTVTRGRLVVFLAALAVCVFGFALMVQGLRSDRGPTIANIVIEPSPGRCLGGSPFEFTLKGERWVGTWRHDWVGRDFVEATFFRDGRDTAHLIDDATNLVLVDRSRGGALQNGLCTVDA